VEDELLIRLEIADYLEGCGYTVLQEPSAADAIVLIRKRPDIDLVSRMSERRARWME
jgi:CheY-like chemotaxis protein